MRYLTLLLLLTSCQSWGWSDTADALMPDEFTFGSGHSTGSLNGYLDEPQGMHDFDFDSTSESDSTYAALTWHLPSFKSDNGMSRDTQRNFALLVDHMVEEEGIAESTATKEPEAITAGPLKMNLREGVSLPSKEILLGVLGGLLLLALFVRFKANASRRRWR